MMMTAGSCVLSSSLTAEDSMAPPDPMTASVDMS